MDYFTKGEIVLWCISVIAVTTSFCFFNQGNYLILLASLIGVTSLIYNAKGNPIGQFLMILFSILYGYISYSFSYYGEMITYLAMTMPMAVIALVTWLKNPFEKNKAEVKINHLSKKEYVSMFILAMLITFVFYFILEYFHTAQIVLSTISVTTSFVAVYLTFRRSAYYAVGYMANDVVLIVLWLLASLEDISYLSVVVCFITFFINDSYGFISWRRMGKRQAVLQTDIVV